ncbi:MAG: type pilus assembly protein PilA [Actinomycetota bacterium]|jgi:prepilin-type N-terminal cleavage/methylation domain-containing protein|nr:type pilus assembly protein PilA [Actinomycetota bacterium]
MSWHNRSPGGEHDNGFTLIELLVVIIIIGILAAIAIPVFLNQRVKAYDTAVRSDLRNLAEFQEGYAVNNGRYATIAEIQAADDAVRVSVQDTVTVVLYDAARGYCLEGKASSSPNTWYWDSLAGGLQPKGTTSCPTVTSGTAGDSLTG